MIKQLLNANQGRRAGKAWIVAGFRFILPGLMAPVLLTAAAFGQCSWPAPVKRALVPIRLVQMAAPASHEYQPPGPNPRGDPGETPEARSADSCLTPAKFEPSRRPPGTPNCPLKPASAFGLQTNLRRYLETWPTPGTTFTDEGPEYVGEESDEDLH